MDFPTLFASWYSHMFLFKNSEDEYELCPPNQCDWFFKLTKIASKTWKVCGFKDDHINITPEKMMATYMLIDGEWITMPPPVTAGCR
jgi:hypothetical protein